MPRLSDQTIRERTSDAIVGALWTIGNDRPTHRLPLDTIARCGGSVWLTMHDGRTFKVVVERVNEA